ncbi:MAG: TetR/AcrR family transcriptional regulator [Sphingomonas bacterium]|nr:TetR/AcrR family transcriptional regulator [Sphingomonas bacterium]
MTISDAPEDGRRLRSKTSRDKMVAAMIELVREGAIMPSADQVATRAEVGLRTVFRQYKDMETLYAAMLGGLSKYYEGWAQPLTASDWQGQLVELTERRVTTYERLLPFKRAGDAHRHMSTSIEAENIRMLALMRARLRTLVPAGVSDMVGFETLDLIVSFAAWQRLRSEQNLSVEQARDVVLTHVTRFIEEAS